MPVNTLTTEVGLRVGPVVLETLVKHYFDRYKKSHADKESTTPLRQEELLYDEVFNIIKSFLRVASYHTIEEVQGFSNTRTPSPPWVHVVRLVVPMSSCDDAAEHLIKAFGGGETARRIIGGVKWWQVRGINGVDAQWITARKDWEEAKRRYKMRERSTEHDPKPTSAEQVHDSGKYEKDMDEMRCILYSHGGGYYFGSVDQERYSIQRHARKINGRVFAVNYRLAPQYPFPCALQDLLAAYLFLIRPPPGAAHRPINPQHIVIAGDSAGGGISLAVLQIIRDSGLPLPAGGVLISPWCDLTHSFPSVHTNTATDVIPAWGLSLQKPSVLWPPPSDEVSNRTHASLKARVRQALGMEIHNPTATTLFKHQTPTSTNHTVDIGTTTPLPTSHLNEQTISITTKSGEILSTDQQLHMYAPNSLLPHPLISSVLSYLGGLPPLLIIASDKEVLRDEIIYAAHKAANPDKYPIKDEIRALYPPLNGIESRYKPTKVHLQVYDDAAHVLPVLFSFTTPAKFCFRAIATFCKHVTELAPTPSSPISPSFLNPIPGLSREQDVESKAPDQLSMSDSTLSIITDNQRVPISAHSERLSSRTLRRSISSNLCRVTSILRPGPMSRSRSEHGSVISNTEPSHPLPDRENSTTSSDVGGPRFQNVPSPRKAEGHTAGNPDVYGGLSGNLWDGTIIRERISTQGIIRALEPETELGAFGVELENIGRLSELTIRRYLDARGMFDAKFAHSIRSIEKERHRNLKLATKDTTRNMSMLQTSLLREGKEEGAVHGIKAGLLASSGNWSWAWALDGEERPPPSSIVSRRDTSEARRLARIADQAVFQDDQSLSGNRFWSAVVNFLTITPDRSDSTQATDVPKQRASKLSQFLKLEPLRMRKSGRESPV